MYEQGQRVELVRTNDPHTRLCPGDQGTVASYDSTRAQLDVHWDSGSRLAMLLDEGDQVRLIQPQPPGSPHATTSQPRHHRDLDRVTIGLDDGRIVDVFPASATVQVYYDNLRHGYEFQLPLTTPTGRDQPLQFIPLA